MDNALHFISGLPRAGSTLLSALLAQNPRFHAGMTGPVNSLVDEMLRAMSMRNETSIFISDAQRETLLRKIFETFHGSHPKDHVSFDTNRSWCSRLPLIARLYPAARVICCVRDLAEIVNSIERLVQRNALQPSGIFSFEPGGTVYSRAEGISGGGGLIGHSFNALREAFSGPYADRLILVTYETLTHEPQRALDAIYASIGQPNFAHDFENVVFDAREFDRRLGTPGLHDLAPKVRASAPEMILPPDLVRKYQGDSFWRDPAANLRNVQVI